MNISLPRAKQLRPRSPGRQIAQLPLTWIGSISKLAVEDIVTLSVSGVVWGRGGGVTCVLGALNSSSYTDPKLYTSLFT